MRILPLSLIVTASLLSLGGCDSNAPEAALIAPTADAVTCSAPSLYTTHDGTYIYVKGFSSFGALLEEDGNQDGNWGHLAVGGKGDTQARATYTPWTGGPKDFVDFRARNICYDTSTDSYVFSSYSYTTAIFDPNGI